MIFTVIPVVEKDKEILHKSFVLQILLPMFVRVPRRSSEKRQVTTAHGPVRLEGRFEVSEGNTTPGCSDIQIRSGKYYEV